jgi:transcription elongation GreA/GreB family factor
MGTTAEGEARRALARLARAMEKAGREMVALEGALRHAEGSDFPDAEYERARDAMGRVERFIEEEGDRLQRKILEQGGLEPGRVRRSSSS